MDGILHLGFNGHLQEDSFKVFEKYYPGKNIMLAKPPRKNDALKIHLPEDVFRWMDYGNPEYYKEILELCKNKKVGRLLLHSASKSSVNLAEYLKTRIKGCKVYWLFWGFELYTALGEDLGVSFVDEKFNVFKPRTYLMPNRIKHYLRRLRYGINYVDVIKKASEVADYFCFWNKYDYDLYTKYFGNKVNYKYFGYTCRYRENEQNKEETYDFPQKTKAVIINHQASVTGNHVTLMRRFSEIDPDRTFKVYMPLSYGSRYLKQYCVKYGYKLFKNSFYPILEYMPREKYFDIINKPQVAMFGQKRQEAAGNIGRLLIEGTKVFLREDNPMLKYYRDKGYYVFSFENDLNSIEDLNPLTYDEKVHNRKVWYSTRTYYEDFMPDFFNDEQ